MTATGHALIGVALAAKISNPVLGIPIAIISHLAADAFPHWDAGTHGHSKKGDRLVMEAGIDVIVGFIISYLLLTHVFPQTNLVYAFFMILAAQSFDWVMAPFYFFKMKVPPFTWAYKFQKIFDNRLDKPWGIINQVVFLILIIIFARYF